MEVQLNPHISVDCVIFGFDSEALKVLLTERKIINEATEQYTTDLKLPGDLISDDEDLNSAAYRVLKELTGLDNVYLEQFHAFGSLERMKNPTDLNWLISTKQLQIQRVVTVAYYSLVKINQSNGIPKSNEFSFNWYDIKNIPLLAFDHNLILLKALEVLQKKIRNEPVGFELLPKKFTKNQLQKLYEVILGMKIDNRNFRKKINRFPYIVPLNEKQKGVAHKPARFYKFDARLYNKFKNNDISELSLTLP